MNTLQKFWPRFWVLFFSAAILSASAFAASGSAPVTADVDMVPDAQTPQAPAQNYPTYSQIGSPPAQTTQVPQQPKPQVNSLGTVRSNSQTVQPAPQVRVQRVQKFQTPAENQSVVSTAGTSSAGNSNIATPGRNFTGENFKRAELPPLYNLGAMTGLGVIDHYGGVAVLGTASMTVIDHGFVPDLSDSVAAEIEAGPMFTSSHTAFWYSLHLRWDFQKDDTWTFYALGGLGGDDTPDSLGGHFEIWPRFGLGTFFRINPTVSLRAEISHEFMGVGVNFPL